MRLQNCEDIPNSVSEILKIFTFLAVSACITCFTTALVTPQKILTTSAVFATRSSTLVDISKYKITEALLNPQREVS